MEPIKTREEALKVMDDFRSVLNGEFSETMDALEDFFLTDEQKEAMKDAEYKYALQIGIDPVFAKYFYSCNVCQMSVQEYEQVRALNTKAMLAFEELCTLELWEHTKRLQLLDQYEAALNEALQILKDNY